MSVRAVTVDDMDWIVAVLAERRRPLASRAPVFWQPAGHAARFHRAFLTRLLTEAGARGYRTDTAVLIAAPRGQSWIVDDAYVPHERWTTSHAAQALWQAFAADCGGDPVRFVCPRYEEERGAFARRVGLTVAESWWLRELPGSGGGPAGVTVDLPGASAATTAAPPVYAPPGPMLFLPQVTDPPSAIPAAVPEALRRGCAGIVVSQRPDDSALAAVLDEGGFRPHCDYYSGVL
ncbi:MAG TPA: hypothetical protein VHF26_07000 [Trebonia sp.]|nr:hypothetical protein [Trebonia sp.]